MSKPKYNACAKASEDGETLTDSWHVESFDGTHEYGGNMTQADAEALAERMNGYTTRRPFTADGTDVRDADGLRVADCFRNLDFDGDAEFEAMEAQDKENAVLFAAAPELVEALKAVLPLGDASIHADILAALKPHERDSFTAIVEACRAALARAGVTA